MATTSETQPKRSPVKRVLPRSLLGRSLLIIVSPLILLQVISTWIFYDRHYDTTTKRLAQGVAGDIAAMVELIDRDPSLEQRRKAFALAENMWLELSFDENATLSGVDAASRFSVLDHKLTAALDGRLVHSFEIDTHSREDRVEVKVKLAAGVLQVLIPRKRLFSSTTYIFIMWMVGSSIILFGVAVLFMRNQVKPIRRLAQAAESFGKGRDVTGFKPEGATEVRQAATAFLQMRERIKRQIQQRTEMLAGVSHDLRTPLTRMKLQLEMLQDSPDTDNLKSDVLEMQQMVEGFLAFARGEGTEQSQITDLTALVQEVAGQMKREGGAIDLHVEKPIMMPLRREAMRRCLTNLMSNALRHGQQVSVTVGQRKNIIEITIDDDGPGIPAHRREDVFKPFFRLDQSRNPETGGVGLGLTIARDVVHNHGGSLILSDAPEHGLRVRIHLPI